MKILKWLLTVLTAALMLFGSACTGGNKKPSGNDTTNAANGTEQDTAPVTDKVLTSEEIAALSDEVYFADYFTPVLRFTVASDAHIDDSDSDQEEKRLAKLFTSAYAYADGQKYKNLDGAFFAGDCSNTGTLSSMKKFFKIVNENVKEGTEAFAVLGNHEFFTDVAKTVDRWLSASGYQDEDAHLVINGYHFLLISPDNNGTGFSKTKQTWLKEELAKAASDDSTGTKPIFVFQHHHVKDTVYGSENWGINDLKNILKQYPQVVDFSGHSHFPINDPRSIWQGSFTALNDGTLSYYEMGIAGVALDGTFPSDQEGGYANSRVSRDAAQYYIVEVDANNAIHIQGYDMISGTFICEYNLRSVGNTEKFTYTNERKTTSAVPEFASDAVITMVSQNGTNAVVSVPQAKCKDNVQHYRFEICNSSGAVIKKIYSLSDTFYIPTPEKIQAKLIGFKAGQTYTIKCYAVSSWEKESKPLTLEIKIPEAGTSGVKPYKSPVIPDVFSVVFKENGLAYDGVSGMELGVMDNGITTENNSTLNRYTGVFDGNGALSYDSYSDFYDTVVNAVSFEFYGKLTTFTCSNQNYVDVFANMQSGGCGFECTSDGDMQFYIMVNGEYHYPSCKIQLNEYFHVVGTFDGSEIRIYLNGQLAASEKASGTMSLPNTDNAKFLCIGGDSDSSGGYEAPFEGTMAAANIYGIALTEAQVTALAAQYVK